ncbi:MAG: hypothetical protein QUS11_00750 [Candidatus Fermentibacter sp.]|nr:hypothetical protein [Candidatus Fermentibacter sp.]
MDPKLKGILRHIAGCCVCSILVFGIVYAAVLVRFTSEYEREGGTTSLLSTAAQNILRVLVFLPGLLGNGDCFGQHSNDVWSWINILLDGCVLYIIWSVVRGRRRRRGDSSTRQGSGSQS